MALNVPPPRTPLPGHPPRNPGVRGQDAIKAYTEAVMAAETNFERIATRILGEYNKLTEAAHDVLLRGVENAERAYNQIANPAHTAYQRQLDAAQHVYETTLNPVVQEYQRIMTRAQQLYNQGLGPAERALKQEITDAEHVSEEIHAFGTSSLVTGK